MEITFRAVIEVLGKPKEHIVKSLQQYIDNLEQDEIFVVLNTKFTEPEQQEESELWAAFAEVEVKAKGIEQLTYFCLEYMPSIIDIITPEEMSFNERTLSLIFNDMQGKLHQVDMIAKQVKQENDNLKKLVFNLMNNYLTVLLKSKKLSSEHLSQLTGVNKEKLEDFLDTMIDKGKIDLKGGVYFLTEDQKESE